MFFSAEVVTDGFRIWMFGDFIENITQLDKDVKSSRVQEKRTEKSDS